MILSDLLRLQIITKTISKTDKIDQVILNESVENRMHDMLTEFWSLLKRNQTSYFNPLRVKNITV